MNPPPRIHINTGPFCLILFKRNKMLQFLLKLSGILPIPIHCFQGIYTASKNYNVSYSTSFYNLVSFISVFKMDFLKILFNPLDLSFPIQCTFQEHTGMNCIPSKDLQDLTFINGSLLRNMVFAHVTKLRISGYGHLSWTVESISSSMLSLFMVTLSHPYTTTGKTTALTM